MSASLQAGDSSELLLLIDSDPANLLASALSGDGLSITTVSRSLGEQLASLCLCHGLKPTTRHYPYHQVLDAALEGDAVRISVVEDLDGKAKVVELRGTVDPEHRKHAEQWVSMVVDRAYAKASKRRKRMKVLVNPTSGTGTGRRAWNTLVKPILEAAGVKLDVTFTERVGHGVDLVKELDIDAYDAVVVVSGDGLIHEVINGLASRPDARRALQLPIGAIPCGSGNALVACVVEPKRAKNVAAAVLGILKGRDLPMDVMSVTQGDRRFFSFLSQAYGLIADVDLGTDHLRRWLGGTRFAIAYVHGTLSQRVYECDIAMKVVESDKTKLAADLKARSKVDDSAIATPVEQTGDGLPPLRFGTVNDPVPSDWTVLTDPVVTVYAGGVSYCMTDFCQFPMATSDGLIDVAMSCPMGKIEGLQLMDGTDKGLHFYHKGVSYYKVEAIRVSPKPAADGRKRWISIDGEAVPFEPYQVEAHRGLARVVGEGWQLPENWTQ